MALRVQDLAGGRRRGAGGAGETAGNRILRIAHHQRRTTLQKDADGSAGLADGIDIHQRGELLKAGGKEGVRTGAGNSLTGLGVDLLDGGGELVDLAHGGTDLTLDVPGHAGQRSGQTLHVAGQSAGA